MHGNPNIKVSIPWIPATSIKHGNTYRQPNLNVYIWEEEKKIGTWEL